MALKVGVVGTGKIGQEHIRRLTETLAGARVVAVSDADSALAKDVAARLLARSPTRPVKSLSPRRRSTRSSSHRGKRRTRLT